MSVRARLLKANGPKNVLLLQDSNRDKWQINDVNTEPSSSGTVLLSAYYKDLMKTSIFVYASVKGKAGRGDRISITPHRQETGRYLVSLIKSKTKSEVVVVFKNQIESYDLNTNSLQQSVRLEIQPSNVFVRDDEIFLSAASSNKVIVLGLDFRKKGEILLRDVDAKESLSDMVVVTGKMYVTLAVSGQAVSLDVTRGKTVLTFENSLSVVTMANSITVHSVLNLVFVLWDKTQLQIYSNVDGCCLHAVTFLQSWKIRITPDNILIAADNKRNVVSLFDMDRIIKLVKFQKVLLTSLRTRERKAFVIRDLPVERSLSEASKLGDTAMTTKERLKTLFEMHEDILLEYDSFLLQFNQQQLRNQAIEEERKKEKQLLTDLKKEVKSQKKTIKFFQNQLQITRRVSDASDKSKKKTSARSASSVETRKTRKSAPSVFYQDSSRKSSSRSETSSDSGVSSFTSASGLVQRQRSYEKGKVEQYEPSDESESDAETDSSGESEVSEYYSTTSEIHPRKPHSSGDEDEDRDVVFETEHAQQHLSNLEISDLGMTKLRQHYFNPPASDPMIESKAAAYARNAPVSRGSVTSSPLSTQSLVSVDGETMRIHGTNVKLEIPPNDIAYHTTRKTEPLYGTSTMVNYIQLIPLERKILTQMDTMYSLVGILAITLLHYTDGAVTPACEPTQYLELHKIGMLNCSFSAGFHGVFWYNSTDLVNDRPILNFKENKKSGVGYLSGEYDIYPNGSLIINQVSLRHEQHFTVVLFKIQSEIPANHIVRVITIVKPSVDFPVINKCGSESRLCLFEDPGSARIVCSVEGAKPFVLLHWTHITSQGEINITSLEKFVPKEGGEKAITELSTDFRLEGNGVLTKEAVHVEHEGTYACVYHDGFTDGVNQYQLFVHVIPDPFYIDIKGCEPGLYCTIEVGVTGSLTCSLFGVRPEVDLTWKTSHGTQSSMIHFFEEKKQVSTDGVTFDITLTSKYKHKALTKEPLVLECAVAGSHAHLFEASRKVQAIFIDDPQTNTDDTMPNDAVFGSKLEDLNHFTVAMLALCAFVAIAAISIVIIFTKVRRRKRKLRRRRSSNREEAEMKDVLTPETTENVIPGN
ncbi:hypothetical protein BSL78_11543 [Apostichopus japonicus]|uniref:Ig-like domain-containing protein n=1 Tax=Stichopus japonicus TaxID=307972 RepID=A0A2G8KUA7_STIJA|nr:hypothetical protein BSL78_11543 [Apostichopus japonicus]